MAFAWLNKTKKPDPVIDACCKFFAYAKIKHLHVGITSAAQSINSVDISLEFDCFDNDQKTIVSFLQAFQSGLKP